MNLKNLLAIAAVALCGTANAQLADGTYYIQNVEAGTWLGAGNNWGTQASALAHADYWKLATVSDGVYSLESVVSNGGTNYYLTGTYCDGGKTNLYINPVAGKDGVYTISTADGSAYLKASGSVVANDGADASAAAAQWKLFSEADMAANLATATIANPVDVTYLIKDHDLGRNNRDYSAWSNTGATAPKTNDTSKAGAMVYSIEAYKKTFNVNQTISDLPTGTYAVYVNGFYRQDGSDQNLPYLYANDVKTTLPARTGSENSMQEAAESFVAGKYLSEPAMVRVENGELTIGVATEGASCWSIFKNFHLYYYGDVSVAEVQLASYVAAYNEAKEAAEACQSLDMADDAMTALNNAIAQNTVDLNNTTAEALTAATSALNAAVTAAKAANLAYRMVTPGSDITDIIVNPNFDGNINGWTDSFSGKLNHGFQNNAAYGPINQFMECWAGQWSGAAQPYVLPNGKLYQTVNLPKGEYEFSADIIATQQQAGQAGYIASLDEVTGIYIYAKSDVLFKSDACNAIGAEPKRYSFTFNTTGGPTELGLLIENTNCNWAVMDNVKLVYNGESTINVVQEGLKEAVADAEDLSGVDANAELKQAYADAVAAATTASTTDGKDDAYYQKALDDMNNAKAAVETSVENYKAIVKINEKAAQLKGEVAAAAYAEVLATYTNKTATEVAPFEAAYEAAKAVATGGYELPVSNTWSGETGRVAAWANPDGEGWAERYQGGAFTGDVMTQTLTGLKKGTYTVTMRGGASYTSGRGFEGATGQNHAYFFANDALQSMEVYDRTSIAAGTLDKAVLTCGVKDDGILKIGIQNITVGANWFVVNLESIVYESDELPAVDQDMIVTDAQWATFIAPFEVTCPAGIMAYTVESIGADSELEMAEISTIPANTPVVLFAEYPINAVVSGVSEAEGLTYTAGLLTGTYGDLEITDGYVLQNGEKGVKFYKVSAEDAITVPANKAYLTTSSEAKSLNFPAATAINALTTGTVEAIYNANGVKQNKLQKGMNIIVVNGQTQKVLVK